MRVRGPAQVAFPGFGGNGWSLMMPLSASKSGSLWTSVAPRRWAVAATNASANDTLCAAFNLAASPQSASSECSHWIGHAFILASAAAASAALRSWVVMYFDLRQRGKREVDDPTAFFRLNEERFHHVRARLVLQECEACRCIQNQRLSHAVGPRSAEHTPE